MVKIVKGESKGKYASGFPRQRRRASRFLIGIHRLTGAASFSLTILISQIQTIVSHTWAAGPPTTMNPNRITLWRFKMQLCWPPIEKRRKNEWRQWRGRTTVVVCVRVRTAKLVPPPTKTTARIGTIDLPWRQSTRPGCPRALHRQVSRLCFHDAGVFDDMVLDWIHSDILTCLCFNCTFISQP